jgi:DNA-binding PadR family transcriptional regulator
LVLSLLERRARHAYELGKLIEQRSSGRLVFHIDSLYPLLYRLETRAGFGVPGSRNPASAGGAATA